MDKQIADSVRQAVIEFLESEHAINEVHVKKAELEEKSEPVKRAAKRCANLAIKAHRLSRKQLLETIRSFAGPGPIAIVVDGAIVAIADNYDRMAVVEPSRVLTL